MQKFSPENFLPLPGNRQKTKIFHSLMTSMTMLVYTSLVKSPSQNS